MGSNHLHLCLCLRRLQLEPIVRQSCPSRYHFLLGLQLRTYHWEIVPKRIPQQQAMVKRARWLSQGVQDRWLFRQGL